jgi:hypothetical protein
MHSHSQLQLSKVVLLRVVLLQLLMGVIVALIEV